MSRTASSRFAAVWLVVLFLCSQGVDAFGLHPCALHGGADAGGSGAHAMHMAHGAGSHHGSHSNAPCTCMGACCAPAVATLPPDPAVTVQALTVQVRVESIAASRSIRSLHQPYLLPYGQAPPSLA